MAVALAGIVLLCGVALALSICVINNNVRPIASWISETKLRYLTVKGGIRWYGRGSDSRAFTSHGHNQLKYFRLLQGNEIITIMGVIMHCVPSNQPK